MVQPLQQDKKIHALEHFRKGCTWEEVAVATGVNRTTLWRWANSDPEFGKAVQEAKADPDVEVEAITYQLACDPDPAHNTLRMFWLNSRKGYKQRSDVTSGDRPIRFIERARNPRDIHAVSTNGHTNGHANGNGLGS